MSLRDQLLKSGLASKQQAKKSAKALKKKKYQQNKAQREDPKLVVDDDITIEIKKKEEARKKADIERNLELEKEKKLDRSLSLFYESKSSPREGQKSYYFTHQTNELLSIPVSDKQREMLAKGLLAIASIDCGESFYIIGKAACGEIKVHHPEFIVVHHDS